MSIVDLPKTSPPTVELRNGDHMTQPEFHAAYEQMPEDFRAELINGIVYVMMSPLKRDHGRKHPAIAALLFLYEAKTPGVEMGDNATIRLGELGEPQPDAFLRIKEEFGGQSHVTPDGYIGGPPELVIEVADSTRAIDLGAKKDDYAKYGVKEYVVACLDAEPSLRWFNLAENRELQAGEDGVCRLEQFPGLWIDGPALFAEEHARLLATLEAGLATPEHAAFAERLAAQGS